VSLVSKPRAAKTLQMPSREFLEGFLKLPSGPMSWRRRDGQSFRGVLEKIDAVALIPAATRKKRLKANAARAKIAGRDLIDAPPLNRVALSTTASDEVIVGARSTNILSPLSVYMTPGALS
jgi:hypothetical protein